MKSGAHVGGHPLHPMLILIPAGGFLITFVFDVIHLFGGDDMWWFATRPVLLVSVLGALAAAIPGLVDLVTVVPKGRATATGLTHLVLNVALVAVMGINTWLRWQVDPGPLVGTPSFGWTALGVAILAVSGWFGWMLVQTFHVGVLEPHESQALPEDLGEPEVRERRPLRTGLSEGEITAH